MIEQIVLDHLAAMLNVPTGMEVPEDATGTFVVVEKTGSGRRNHIRDATLAVQSYAPTKAEAAALNEKVKTAMDALADRPEIGRSALNSDYDFTDTASKRYRYQAVFEITYY